jgi:hypothetical protein
MPCHPHQLTKPSFAMLGTTSALLNDGAEQCAVVGREAARGIAADNLLTGPGSESLLGRLRTTFPCFSTAQIWVMIVLSEAFVLEIGAACESR